MTASQADGTSWNRIERVRAELGRRGIEALFVTPSADFLYLTGRQVKASERPMLLALTRQEAIVLAPAFEVPALALDGSFRIAAYNETEDPFAALAPHLPPIHLAAISDQAWASVPLGLQRLLAGATFTSATPTTRTLRMTKSVDEISLLRRAAHGVDAAFEELVKVRFGGRTEQEIASQLDRLIVDQGLQKANWGPIVASGPNSAYPHHVVSDRMIRKGEAVLLDYGAIVDGYQADTTRTVHVGQPNPEFVAAYEVVQRAQEAAVQAVKAGVEAESVDRAARNLITHEGMGVAFTHRTGHGLGLDTHEEPYIVAGNTLRLEPGMTFSVEPGVYFNDRFGIRIEDIVVVTNDGVERLNQADRDLKIVV